MLNVTDFDKYCPESSFFGETEWIMVTFIISQFVHFSSDFENKTCGVYEGDIFLPSTKVCFAQ